MKTGDPAGEESHCLFETPECAQLLSQAGPGGVRCPPFRGGLYRDICKYSF